MLSDNNSILNLSNQFLKKFNFFDFSIIEINENNFNQYLHIYAKISKKASLNFSIDKNTYNESLQLSILEELPCQIVIFKKDLCLSNSEEYLVISHKNLNFIKILRSTNSYFIPSHSLFKISSYSDKDKQHYSYFKKKHFEVSEYNYLYFHEHYGFFNRETLICFSDLLFNENGKSLEIEASIVYKDAPILKGLKNSTKCDYYLLLNLYYSNKIINKISVPMKYDYFENHVVKKSFYLDTFDKLIEPFMTDISHLEPLSFKFEPTKEYVDFFYKQIKPLNEIIKI
jgi:hypothetical protein